MIQDAEIPRNLADLFRDPQKVRDAFVLLRQVANMKIITDDRPITTPKVFPNARDMTIDLRSGTPTGALIAPAGGPFIPYANDAFVVTKTTNSATVNAANLLTAYVSAKALTPNGATRSATNRAALFVAPGNYDFGTGGQFVVDAEFVDVIGLSPNRENQILTSAHTADGKGTLHQQANDVRFANLWLKVNANGTSSGAGSYAYYPDASYALTRIVNCKFTCDDVLVFNSLHSMRLYVDYAGYYQDCYSQAYGWGQGDGLGSFSGTAINCTCDGEGGFGTAYICSGLLIGCTAGVGSGGGFGNGGTGRFSGTAFSCVGFGGSFGAGGIFSGKTFNCTGGNTSWTGTLTSAARIVGCLVTTTSTFGTPAAGGIIASSVDTSGIVNFPAIPGFANPMTTAGDTIYGGAAGVATRLPVGANGALNYVSAGLPAWLAPLSSGAILYLSASLVPTWLPRGFDGAVLTMVSGVPAWVGGTPPATEDLDYIGSRVFQVMTRQVFSITTFNG